MYKCIENLLQFLASSWFRVAFWTKFLKLGYSISVSVEIVRSCPAQLRRERRELELQGYGHHHPCVRVHQNKENNPSSWEL